MLYEHDAIFCLKTMVFFYKKKKKSFTEQIISCKQWDLLQKLYLKFSQNNAQHLINFQRKVLGYIFKEKSVLPGPGVSASMPCILLLASPGSSAMHWKCTRKPEQFSQSSWTLSNGLTQNLCHHQMCRKQPPVWW